MSRRIVPEASKVMVGATFCVVRGCGGPSRGPHGFCWWHFSRLPPWVRFELDRLREKQFGAHGGDFTAYARFRGVVAGLIERGFPDILEDEGELRAELEWNGASRRDGG